MSAVLPENEEQKEMITNKVPIQAFILTKEHSPRDSQDDNILSQTLKNYPKF